MNLHKLLFLYLMLCTNAQASLLQWDAFVIDDGKAVKDQSSGLVWLDLDLTAGLTYNQASANFNGWEYATHNMVEALLDGFFANLSFAGPKGLEYQYEQDCDKNTFCYQNAKDWQSLFGSVTGNQPWQQHSFGLYADADNVIRMGGAYVNGSSVASRYDSDFNSTYSKNSIAPLYGTFLVKSDSIVKPTVNSLPVNNATAPSSITLLCLVLPLLFIRLYKR